VNNPICETSNFVIFSILLLHIFSFRLSPHLCLLKCIQSEFFPRLQTDLCGLSKANCSHVENRCTESEVHTQVVRQDEPCDINSKQWGSCNASRHYESEITAEIGLFRKQPLCFL